MKLHCAASGHAMSYTLQEWIRDPHNIGYVRHLIDLFTLERKCGRMSLDKKGFNLLLDTLDTHLNCDLSVPPEPCQIPHSARLAVSLLEDVVACGRVGICVK